MSALERVCRFGGRIRTQAIQTTNYARSADPGTIAVSRLIDWNSGSRVTTAVQLSHSLLNLFRGTSVPNQLFLKPVRIEKAPRHLSLVRRHFNVNFIRLIFLSMHMNGLWHMFHRNTGKGEKLPVFS